MTSLPYATSGSAGALTSFSAWQEIHYGRKIAGYDLNEYALKRNLSQLSDVCCYDIYAKDPFLAAKFDLIFLFDVLEHIDDEVQFLKAVIHHLAPSGRLVMNVPAGQCVYSNYDRADGHKRRYSFRSLKFAAERSGLGVVRWTYWGLPLLPLVILRKWWLAGQTDDKKIISAGFESKSQWSDKALWWLSLCEHIPQKIAGSSLMAVLQLDTN
jgi:SAM-dependent methyltransferase